MVYRKSPPHTQRRETCANMQGRAGTIMAERLGSMRTSTRIDGGDYPLAIFRFKYRSRGEKFCRSYILSTQLKENLLLEALQQLMVIERTPEPNEALGLTPAQKHQLDDFARFLKVSSACCLDVKLVLTATEWRR